MMVNGLGTMLRIKSENIYEVVAKEVLNHLCEAEEYWANKT